MIYAMNMVRIIKAVAVVGGLFNLSTLGLQGDYSSLFLVGLGLIFSILVISPYIVAFNQAHYYAKSRPAGLMFLGAIMVAITFSVWAYTVTFVTNTTTDAQDGIVLAVSPVFQLIGIGVAILIADFIASRWK